MCLNNIKFVHIKFGDEIMHIQILLKQVRAEKNMTLAKLSEKTGISTTHINDIENNLKEPSLSMMVRLAKGLDVNINELYKVIW
jgi:transcriptional regulator with XRE-family HTH domain